MIEQVNSLNEILEPTAGQTVFNLEDNSYYRYDPIEGWKMVKPEGNFQMQAYDINKQIVGQLEILDEIALASKAKEIRDFAYSSNYKFFMLLCRDLNYYTVFYLDAKQADETIEDVVIECAQDVGEIKAIDFVENNVAIEFWVTNEDNESFVMYFFPYDNGVVLCG